MSVTAEDWKKKDHISLSEIIVAYKLRKKSLNIHDSYGCSLLNIGVIFLNTRIVIIITMKNVCQLYNSW